MCSLTEFLNKTSVTGYKVVAKSKKNGKYYRVGKFFRKELPLSDYVP